MEENRVKLDGEAIRRIREEKKLTQLYIAKVVGVTTDTVSRWENNRYPSVRRENAEQLAEALEVPVDEILRPSAPVATLVPSRSLRRRWWWIALPVGVVLVVVTMFFWPDQPLRPAVTATRLLPVYSATKSVIPVRLHIQVEKDVDALVVREDFPAGWQLVEGSPPPSSLDNVGGTARWIVQQVEPEMQISYLLRVGTEPDAGMVPFRGEIVVSQSGRSRTLPIDGVSQTEVALFHWADTNGDRVIDDSEALEASVASSEMKQTHLDWSIIERIWDAGGYRLDAERSTFIPQPRSTGKEP